MRHGAEQRPADLLLTGAPEAHEAEKFALPDLERHRTGCRRHEIHHASPHRTCLQLRFSKQFEVGAAYDETDEFGRRRFGHRLLADLEAVPHHDDTVGDAEDLVEAMRHVDHPHAPRPEAPDGVEQPVDLVGRKARRRLVEH